MASDNTTNKKKTTCAFTADGKMAKPTYMAELERSLSTLFPLSEKNTLHDKPIPIQSSRGYPPMIINGDELVSDLQKKLFERHKDVVDQNEAKVGHEDREARTMRDSAEFEKRRSLILSQRLEMANNATKSGHLFTSPSNPMNKVIGPVPAAARVPDSKFSCPRQYSADLQKHNTDAANRLMLWTEQCLLPNMPKSLQVQYLLNALVVGHEPTILSLMPLVGGDLPETMDYEPNDFSLNLSTKVLERAPRRVDVPLLVAIFELQPALLAFAMDYITWDESDVRAAIVRYEELLAVCTTPKAGMIKSGYARYSNKVLTCSYASDVRTSHDTKDYTVKGGWVGQCGQTAWPIHYRHNMARANADLVLQLVKEEHLHQMRERQNLENGQQSSSSKQKSPIQKMALHMFDCDTPYKTAMLCHSRMLRLAILYPGFRHLFNKNDVKEAIEFALVNNDEIMSLKVAGQRLEAGRIEKLLAFLSLVEHPHTPRCVKLWRSEPSVRSVLAIAGTTTVTEDYVMPEILPSFAACKRMGMPLAPEGDTGWTLLAAALTVLPTCICALLTATPDLDVVEDVPYICKKDMKSEVSNGLLIAALTRTLLNRFQWSRSAVWRAIECVTHNCAAWSQWCFIQSIKYQSDSNAAPSCRRAKIIRFANWYVLRLLRESIAGPAPPLSLTDEQAWSEIKKYYAPLLSEMANVSVSKMMIDQSPIVNDRPLKRLNTVYNADPNELPNMGYIMQIFIQQLNDMGLTSHLEDFTRPCPAAHISLFETNHPLSAMRNVLLVIRDLLYAFSFEEFDKGCSDDAMKPCRIFKDFINSFMWSTEDIQTLQAMIVVSALPAKLKQYALKVLTEAGIATLELKNAPVPFVFKTPVLPHCPSTRTDLALWKVTKNIVDEAPSFYALAALSCQPHFVILVNQMIEKCATSEQPAELKAIHLTGKWLLQKFVGGSAHHIPIMDIKTQKDLDVLSAVSKFMYGCGKEPRKKFEQIEFIPYPKTNSAYECIVRLIHTTCGKIDACLRVEIPSSVTVPKWSKQWELNQSVKVDDSTYEQLSILQVLMLNSPSAIIALLKYKYSPVWLVEGNEGRRLLEWMCDTAVYVVDQKEVELAELAFSQQVAFSSCQHYYELLELLFAAPYSVKMKSWVLCRYTRWAYTMAVRVAKREQNAEEFRIYARDNSFVSEPDSYDNIGLNDVAVINANSNPCTPKRTVAPLPEPPKLAEATTNDDHAAKRQRVESVDAE